VRIYELLAEGALHTRLDLALRRGLAPFVGRRSDLSRLHEALEYAKDGQGQIVSVVGEPGVGKSRLVHEFKSKASGCRMLEGFAFAHGVGQPYLPLIGLLRGYFQIDPRDDPDLAREKVERRLDELGGKLPASLPYLCSVLGITGGPALHEQMNPAIRRRRTFKAVKDLLLRESREQPLIVAIDDAQWIDGETHGCLDVIADALESERILLVVDYRPGFQHAWDAKQNYREIRLDALSEDSARSCFRRSSAAARSSMR